MKKLIVLSLLVITSQVLVAQTTAFDKIVSRFKAKGWVKMNLNGDFDFSSDIHKDGSAKVNGVSLNLGRAKSKQKNVHLVILSDDAHLQTADFQSFVTEMKQSGYQDLMTVRKGKNNISFMGHEKNKGYDDLALLIRSENGGAVLMRFEGNYSQRDIEAIIDGK
jgi:hypothetical protein